MRRAGIEPSTFRAASANASRQNTHTTSGPCAKLFTKATTLSRTLYTTPPRLSLSSLCPID